MKFFACLAMMMLLAPIAWAAGNTDTLESARAAIRVKDYRRAVAVLHPAVQAGDADAQFLLASLQRAGLGIDADPAAARKLLIAAAEHGHSAAAYSLATMLVQEEPRDPLQARNWLQRAAQEGHRLAQAAIQRGSLPLQFLPQLDLTETGARRAAFWRAIQEDDVATAAALADHEMFTSTDGFGRGALAHAAQRGAEQAVALLIANGAKVDQADSYGTTPLMLAAANAELAIVDGLLRAQANANAVDRVGNTALMYVCGRNPPDTAVVERLLRAARTDVVNAQGWSALDWAVAADAKPVMALLRERGLVTRRKVTVAVEAPEVPLRRAVGSGVDLYRGLPDVQVAATRSSPEMLKAVLQSAPSMPIPDAAIYSATVAESVPTLQALFESGSGLTGSQQSEAMRWAVRHADAPVVQALLTRGIGVRDASGNESALITAVRAHRGVNVSVLLDAQLPVDAVDATGMTALMIAAASAQTDVVTQLLKHLARTDLADKAGRTALWHAAGAGATDAADALLAARSPVDAADASGQTPLAAAAARGHAQIVAALLKAGAGASTRTAAGATPLMLAARSGNAIVIRALVAAGATVDAQNRHGDTALIVAARSGQPEAVRLLLAAGASDKLRNADRASALDVAGALGLSEIERLLTRG